MMLVARHEQDDIMQQALGWNFDGMIAMALKEKEIAELETEKALIEAQLCSGTLSVDELTEKSKRLPEVNDLIDEKTMRWLELSEIES